MAVKAEWAGGRVGAPLIGISAYCEQGRWGAWDQPAIVLPRRYADRVAAAGGIPVLLHRESGVSEILGNSPWVTVIDRGRDDLAGRQGRRG